MLAQYAKATDPSSGGRQMPGHYGDRRHNLLSVSSPVATQILHGTPDIRWIDRWIDPSAPRRFA